MMKTMNENIGRLTRCVCVGFACAFAAIALMGALAVLQPSQAFALGTPHVVDNANILSADEEAALSARIDGMIADHNADFLILTDTTLQGKSVRLYCAEYYESHGYGYGDDINGLVMFIYMPPSGEGRCWYTAFTGDCMRFITEDNLSTVDDAIESYMKNLEFSKALNVYLDKMDTLFTYEKFPAELSDFVPVIVFALVFGALVGLINQRSKKRKMVTIAVANDARTYVIEPFELTASEDEYINTTVVATPRGSHDDHDDGHGGGLRFSGGFSTGGGHSFGGGGRSF